ncbi:hypothetical protein, partial [Salmonella enterica]|uniref:hypothetical protein n=1 Tax=Salmonella enterica TaxID=28901 RepID=UPI003296D8F7
RYQLASDFWDCPCVTIRIARSDDRIATFPIDFLRQGGDNTWNYIYTVVAELVCRHPTSQGQIVDDKGTEVDPDGSPLA